MNTGTPESREALAPSAAVGTALRDVREALSALFMPALIGLVILFAMQILRAPIVTGLTAGPPASKTLLIILVYEAVKAFLMTPYAIAVHRFIILGEKTTSYRIAPAETRFRRFFGWSLALLMLVSTPAAISTLFEPGPTRFVVLVVLSIAATLVVIRAIILFPAVAVDAPGANWRQAMARHQRLCVAYIPHCRGGDADTLHLRLRRRNYRARCRDNIRW
jgi:hypothetical protein